MPIFPLFLPPDQRERLEAFARMLIDENRVLNLTAVTDLDEVRVRHVEDSLAALPYLREIASDAPSLIDIGSGAGLPGLALAIALPEWRIVSVEATGKKARFQKKVVQALGLSNVTVTQGRAETLAHDPAHRERYDAATARALAPLPVVAELTLPFVRLGGSALAWKGPSADEEIARARRACDRLGGRVGREIAYHLSVPPSDAPRLFRLVILSKTQPTPAAYPRGPNAIRKRPLG